MPIQISRILHAGYIFQCSSTKIIFDPIFENPFSRNCYAFPDIEFDHQQIKEQKFDAVFISHFHDDHCSFESLNLIDRQTPIYLYCQYEELFSLLKELGFKNVYSLTIDQPVKIQSFEITPRRALDADVDSLFQIKADGLNILNVVDSWIDTETFQQLIQQDPWDLILWPFQTMREIEVIAPSRASPAEQTMPQEWLAQLKALNPKHIVPSSCQFIQETWSWYRQAYFPISYQQFQKEIEAVLPDTKIVRMNPSVTMTLSKDSLIEGKPLQWIKPIGPQDVDYEYQENAKPQATDEIAKKIIALDTKQIERVYDYCTNELLEKYQSLLPPLDPYFDKPRHWQLSVYDHKGDAKNFYYTITGNHIERTPSDEKKLAWLTEVPATKLYAALEQGESLSSMYVRINDMVFSESIEKEIQEADIMEDPLIRTLFTGVFGAYQSAQLKKLSTQLNL